MHVCMCHNLMLVYLFFLNSQACWGPLQDLVIFLLTTQQSSPWVDLEMSHSLNFMPTPCA